MAITKNRQSQETIVRMAKQAFPGKTVVEIRELPEGMCNVTYCVTFHDGSESILKIAAKGRKGNLTNEQNLMQAEVTAMQLVSKRCSFKVPEVQYYDPDLRICDGSYFFMEKIDGENFHNAQSKLPQDVIAKIHTELGQIAKELSAVQNTGFGFLGEDQRFDSLYEFVKYMLRNLISDAAERNIDILYDGQYYLTRLRQDKYAFASVARASFVHWDMWEGNVFVKDGQVTGIIDWERALWGEPYMDDRFRAHNRCDAFLAGFGKTAFDEAETIRMRWYDIILYLTMMIEVFYREYQDQGQYFWARSMLEKCVIF